MIELLEDGYVCQNCGRSVLDDEPEADYFPFCCDDCLENFYGKSIEEMDEFNE